MRRRLLSTLFLSLCSMSAQADVSFAAPPREDSAEAQKLYAPLVEELGRALGEKVVFVPTASWAEYSDGVRQGKYDLVLDGPHFVAWRAVHTRHVPVVRVDGKLRFTLFVRKEGPANLGDLRFKEVCAVASPNLAAVVLLSQFDAYTAPNVLAPRGGMKGTFAAFEAGRCEAVMLPGFFIEQLSPEKRAQLRELFTSPEMPNLALTAGPRIPAEKRKALQQALLASEAQTRVKPVLDAFGTAGAGWQPASAEEYAGYQRLLEGVVWGW